MSFYCYKGIPESALDESHITSSGESYTLRHNDMLRVELPFLGKNAGKTNSQGWERNNFKYFTLLYRAHPELFSKKNIARLDEKTAPIVDQKMIQYIPEWEPFRNQTLIHHHIGGDGEIVAVPESVHSRGSGEIHIHETALGITDSCRQFSEWCASQPSSSGKNATLLHSEYNSLKRIDSLKTNASSGINSNAYAQPSYTKPRNNIVYKSPRKENRSKLLQIAKKAGEFVNEHREVIGTVAKISLTVAQAVVDIKSTGIGHTGSSFSSSGFTVDDRASPREHTVSGYVRQQNGKSVQVSSYKRGGKGD